MSAPPPTAPAPAGPRARFRRFRLGLTTITGLARRGFFIPHRYAADIRDPEGIDAYPALLPMFESRRAAFGALIEEIAGLAEPLRAIGREPPPAPRWDQGWFAPLDAAAAYALVRTRRPGRIVEVGSGHSTRFLARAVRDGGLATSITAIDPAPRARLPENVTAIAKPLQAALDVPAALGPGDILFIDSSHILMPGTDVDLALTHLWPRLAPGTLVHFHDIFLPDGYPAAWRWRGYNEQLGVAALLAGTGADIVFASHYVATRMEDALAKTALRDLPRLPGAIDSSLWIEKRG